MQAEELRKLWKSSWELAEVTGVGKKRPCNVQAQGEAASADGEAVARDPEHPAKTIPEGAHTKQQVFNTDATVFHWKMPSRTFMVRKTSTPGFKSSKDRLAFSREAGAAGDLKRKPMLIAHSEKQPLATMLISSAYALSTEQQSLEDSTAIYHTVDGIF